MFAPLARIEEFKYRSRTSIRTEPVFSIIRKRHNTRLFRELYRRELYPARSNLLTKLLSPIREYSDVIDLVRRAKVLGLTTPNNIGTVLHNVFHRDPVKEIIIAGIDGSDSEGVDIVDVIHYPFSGIVPPLPNGRDYNYPEATAVYSINLNRLIKVYKEYLLDVKGKQEVKDIRFFVFKYMVQPLLTRLVDVSISNSYIHLELGTDPLYMEAIPNEIYLYPYVFSFNNLLKYIKRRKLETVTDTSSVFNQYYLPIGNMNDTCKVSNKLSILPRFHWAYIYGIADRVMFLNEVNKTNSIKDMPMELLLLKINLKRIKYTIKQYIPPGIKKEVVSKINELTTSIK